MLRIVQMKYDLVNSHAKISSTLIYGWIYNFVQLKNTLHNTS